MIEQVLMGVVSLSVFVAFVAATVVLIEIAIAIHNERKRD